MTKPFLRNKFQLCSLPGAHNLRLCTEPASVGWRPKGQESPKGHESPKGPKGPKGPKPKCIVQLAASLLLSLHGELEAFAISHRGSHIYHRSIGGKPVGIECKHQRTLSSSIIRTVPQKGENANSTMSFFNFISAILR